jgi:hypothetical protein
MIILYEYFKELYFLIIKKICPKDLIFHLYFRILFYFIASLRYILKHLLISYIQQITKLDLILFPLFDYTELIINQ